mmetsp:Transcript_23849/g.80549  ORF Transcript_23849/g.80549 Transcript_23849/m.80549 type:complete len:102 (-) Transcript_23849:6-311(-)
MGQHQVPTSDGSATSSEHIARHPLFPPSAVLPAPAVVSAAEQAAPGFNGGSSWPQQPTSGSGCFANMVEPACQAHLGIGGEGEDGGRQENRLRGMPEERHA